VTCAYFNGIAPKDETPEFRHSCACRIATAFEDLATLEENVQSEGADGLQYALATALEFASESPDGARPYLRSMLRVFQRECHRLREWNPGLEPNRFAEQFLFRALTLGETRLAENAERRLTDLAHPALILRWRTLSESPALVRILSGHQDTVSSVAVSPDGRRIVSVSEDRTVVVWDLDSGQRLATLALDGSVRSTAWHPDGRFVLAGDVAGDLYRLEYREH
jgi:WD40 repeat protein